MDEKTEKVLASAFIILNADLKKHQELKGVLEKYDLWWAPHVLYYFEEHVINTIHEAGDVVIGAWIKTFSLPKQKSTTTLVYYSGNATGQLLPPFIIFKGKRMCKKCIVLWHMCSA